MAEGVRVKALRGFRAHVLGGGLTEVRPNETVTLPKLLALQIVASNKAELVPEEPAPPAQEPAEPVVEPKPESKSRAKKEETGNAG